MRRWVAVSAVTLGWLVLPLAAAAVDDAGAAHLPSATTGLHAPSSDEPPATAPITTEVGLRRAWADPQRTRIDLGADIVLRDCHLGDPIRETPYPMLLDGHGHSIRQACFEKRVLRQDGTGWLELRDVTLTRGGSDGPGAALTSRGEIELADCVIKQNLAEEPGGGVFSMRRVTVHRCRITGNLANDDGGGVYARRGGVQIYDSVLSTNLVDGSGGAVGSTGDILVVDSWVDGNTTDGDGGALYADEDGDVTVIRSLIDGSDADGPGGAVWALDGDIAVLDSSLIGNRADDRGGAIGGEADVLVVNSTVARNLAVAHAGGGIWARGDLTLVNSTVTANYAEGEGGGVLAAGRTTLVASTVLGNIASVAGDVGSSGPMTSFGSILGPPVFEGVTGDTIPTRRSCRVYAAVSQGHNYVADASCELDDPTDDGGADPLLARLEDDPRGFVLVPLPGSPVLGQIPADACRGRLPDPLPAGQLLAAHVDWDRVLAADAVGTPRDDGAPCDIGAVESDAEPSGAGPPPQEPPVPADPPTQPRADRRPAPGDGDPPRRAAPDPDHRFSIARMLDRIAGRLRVLDRRAQRFDVLLDCTTRVGVDRVGDRRHRWGFAYDEQDGTGVDLRPALVRHRGPGPAQHDLLALGTQQRCLSAPADPNGTGADARRPDTGSRPSPGAGSVVRRLHRLERLEAAVERRTERFDAWESCLSWLPVTESGDLEQGLGYLADEGIGPYRRTYYPALDLDRSEWEDPDYQVLAFGGRDRPLAPGECGRDPGEGPDRRPGARAGGLRDSRGDLLHAVRDLREEVADLGEPVGEITTFDECAYTVGMRSTPGYLYRDRPGEERRRAALSFDLRGAHLPELSVLAFPSEEPPQIECNEDAGGQGTDE